MFSALYPFPNAVDATTQVLELLNELLDLFRCILSILHKHNAAADHFRRSFRDYEERGYAASDGEDFSYSCALLVRSEENFIDYRKRRNN